jgi:RND family efflux transporter MFP subunit
MKRLLVVAALAAAMVLLGLKVFQEAAADGPATPPAGFASGGRGRGGGTSILVGTGRVEPHVFRTGREFTGELRPRTQVEVASRISGYLESILVEEADPVRSGQLIGAIDGADIQQQIVRQEAALAVAEAGAVRERATLENIQVQDARTRTLYEDGLVALQAMEDIESRLRVAQAQSQVAEAQVDQAQASLEELKIQFERTRLYSPMDGVVAVRHVDPGALVSQNVPVITIVDVSRLKMVVPVPEGSIPDVGVGYSAEMRFDAFPGRVYQGEIVRISPVMDTETRTVNFEIVIDNPTGNLRPGMFARVSVGGAASAPAPSVPRAALITKGDTDGVYLLGEDAVATFRQIVAGRAEDGWIEALGGIGPEEVFITTGAQNVNDGDRVRLMDESPPLGGRGPGAGDAR